MARRRVYVFDLAAILADAPPPPKRLWSSLLMAALVGAMSALTVVAFRLLVEATPHSVWENLGIFLLAYAMIMLLFGAVAARLRYRNP